MSSRPARSTTPASHSSGLIVVTRLMAAACMLSAMAAVLRFEVTTLTGRVLTLLSMLVSFSGQLFVMKATKPDPATWVLALLPVFWIGVAALAVAWIVVLA